MEFYVYLTNDCNLNCHYCSVIDSAVREKLPIRPSYQINELCDFIVDQASKNAANTPDVYFFGGEPTLEFDLMARIMDALANNKARIVPKYILHTNGLLLNSVPRQIASKLTLIVLSINYHKLSLIAEEKSYYETVVENALDFKFKYDIPIISRFTVTESMSLFAGISLLQSTCEYTFWQIENSQFNSKYQELQKQYMKDLGLLYKKWYWELSKGNLIGFLPFISMVRLLLFNEIPSSHFYCGYGKSMLYIQTDGRVLACSDSTGTNQHFLGNIKEGVRFENLGKETARCQVCDIKQICGGRCGRMHAEFTSSRINQYCSLTKYMVSIFQNNSEDMNNILRKYPTLTSKIMSSPIQYSEIIP